MKNTGHYWMLAVTVVFLITTLCTLSSRHTSHILAGNHNQPLMTESTTAKIETMSVTKAGKLNINAASAEELELLPGIGEVLAQRIVTYRDENGNFTNIEELLEVKGIGPAKLGAIKDYITIG